MDGGLYFFCIALLIGILVVVFYTYRSSKKEDTDIHTMFDYFANSGYSFSSLDDILWDISRNCISRLNFEDCVIYLVDKERKVLVQKAAYGPKNPKPFQIKNPIEIEIGKGITGCVAATGKALLIKNTALDKRYIQDDEKRNSEIAVPIIHDNEVIGVIDSENRRKGFFTTRHLEILQTIAVLCSAKISRALTEEAMQRSKLEMMELNIKMAETKLANLRLQMNPHFIFNALSAIQNLIISHQTNKAYQYLTIFSNLLRSLLKYAERNLITLDSEIQLLKFYLQLESLRFDDSFKFDIHIDEDLDQEDIFLPPLLIQPFVENAIWHGLMHKEGVKQLYVSFQYLDDDFLSCTIEDNGIGRLKSKEINDLQIPLNHQSRAIEIVNERLKLVQEQTSKSANIEILDLYDDQKEPQGTKVTLITPLCIHMMKDD